MSSAGLKQLDHGIYAANVWLSEIMDDLDVDRHTAWCVLGAVLHTLRDRLSVEQIAHLGDQLPLIIRGLFYDQWNGAANNKKIRARADFLSRVKRRLKMKEVTVTDAVETVFGVLMRHPKGEIKKIIKTLPPAIRALAQAPQTQPSREPSLAWE